MLLSGTPITVNTTSDTANDANINGLTVSLREAINFANADTGHQDTITFASSLTDAGPATITLNGTELVIQFNDHHGSRSQPTDNRRQ